MPCYLLHFSRPLRHARHYVGLTKDLDELRRRITDHRKGRSTGLLKAVVSEGITLILAHVWEEGDREFEKKLKRRLGAAKFCPICRLETRYGLTSHTDDRRAPRVLGPAPAMGQYMEATMPDLEPGPELVPAQVSTADWRCPDCGRSPCGCDDLPF